MTIYSLDILLFLFGTSLLFHVQFFFFFLVLPLYCYQLISLHPHAHMFSHVIPWTSARQAPLSMDFSRQEYRSGLPFPSPPCPVLLPDLHTGFSRGQVVWYSHLFKNFPQFVVIHTVKGFGIVKAERDVFLELSWFFNDPEDVANLISGSSPFSKTSLNIWKFMVHVLLNGSRITKAWLGEF